MLKLTSTDGYRIVRDRPTGVVPKVSVVIPSYNRQDTIRQAVASVLYQTMAELEVIIVDDQSRDGTLAALESVNDDRLRVFQLDQNGGAPRARNIGAAISRAPMLAFHDSDDIWTPDKLELQLERVVEANLASFVCYGRLIQCYGSGIRCVPPESQACPEGMIFTELLNTSFISTQTLLMPASAFWAVDGFDVDMPRLQDWDLVLRLAKRFPFLAVQRPVALAFETSNSITRNVKAGVIAREMILAKHGDIFAKMPQVLARHEYILGAQSQSLGDFEEASAHFRRSIRAQPTKLLAWARLSSCTLQKVI